VSSPLLHTCRALDLLMTWKKHEKRVSVAVTRTVSTISGLLFFAQITALLKQPAPRKLVVKSDPRPVTINFH
jgi:hypothetical protein